MKTKKKTSTYNLMLSPSYVPGWGDFDALREFISNAKDAGDHSVEFNDNRVVISTPSNPSLSQMLMMGCGDKASDSSTIGQFGEGMKVAALVLTRGNRGLTICTPMGTFTFGFRTPPGFDSPSLHTLLDHSTTCEGCRVEFSGANLKELYDTRFIDSELTQLGKAGKTMKLFSKGVFITEIKEKALYNWNINDLKLNRDRSIPNMFDVKWMISSYLGDHMDIELAKQILTATDSFEFLCLKTYSTTGSSEVLRDAFYEMYGDNAVIASKDHQENAIAAYKGHKVVQLDLDLKLVQNASDIVNHHDRYESVDTAQYLNQIKELEKLADIVEIGPVVFEVFKADPKTMGYHEGSTIGINERLFLPGQRMERLSTYLHELAHHKGGGDASIKFEDSLGYICGKLAIHVLGVYKNGK